MFYEALIRIYVFAIFIAAKSGNDKAKKWLKGRKNWRNILTSIPKNATLFHCASLGEFDQAVPLIREWTLKFPENKVIVSFYSPSGMEHYQKRGVHVDAVCYLPLDTAQNMKDFLSILSPQRLLLIKYEFWPNLIREASLKNIPIFSVATILRPNQVYFKWYGAFFRTEMRKIARFFTQNEETNELLKGIGCDHVLCVGDTRYDMVLSRKSTRISDVKLDNFMKGRRAIILGSSWEKEELILKTSLKFLRNETIIIAPHEVTELSIGRIKKLFPEAICYTEGNLDSSKNILILDTIGQLANAYAHGFMAFIGGGFHGGLHNILEPAVYGLPVCFGPKHTKFPEAKAFITHGFSQEIHSAEDLINFINSTKSNQDKKQEEISAYVQRQQGAALKIVNQFS